LTMIAGGFAAQAHAAQIILSVGDSYPGSPGSAVDYDSLAGLVKNQPAPGDTLTLSTPGMPAGLTSASIKIANDQGNLGLASASLEEGVVRGTANGGPGLFGIVSRNTFSDTSMHDSLTFHISDDAVDALVGVHVHLDGTEAGAGLGSGGYNMDMPFSLGGSFDYFGTIVNNGNQAFGLGGPSGFNQTIGWESYTLSNASMTGFDFDGVIRVTDGETQGVNMSLFLNCYDNTTCDFSHTGRVTLSLPNDVTFTSGSGVFLTAKADSGGVPEPASWALMLVGFAGLGAALRRRQAAVLALG